MPRSEKSSYPDKQKRKTEPIAQPPHAKRRKPENAAPRVCYHRRSA